MKTRAVRTALVVVVFVLAAVGVGGSLMVRGAVTPNPPLVCSSPQGATGAMHHAGLVVTFGDGRLPLRFCIGFEADTISGIELLQSSRLPLLLAGGGIGAAVCAIDGVGSEDNSSYPTCFNTRPNSWAYFHYVFVDGVGSWTFSNVGASQAVVKDGDVDGWSWGIGRNAPPAPPDGIFAAPTAPPTDTPLATSTQVPEPTATIVPPQAPAATASAAAASATAPARAVGTAAAPENVTPLPGSTDMRPVPSVIADAQDGSPATPESVVEAAARTPAAPSPTARATTTSTAPTPPSGVVVIGAEQAKENASHAEAVARTDGGGRGSLFVFAGLVVAVIAVGGMMVYRRRQLG